MPLPSFRTAGDNMTVLITGGMGFIGLSTVEAFLDAGEDVALCRAGP